MGEVVGWGRGREYTEKLYFLLSFAVNLKLLSKITCVDLLFPRGRGSGEGWSRRLG